MADERLRALEREDAASATPETRHALRLYQARVGAFTTAEAQKLLVDTLRARFVERMRKLVAVPLGPIKVGEDWPQNLTMNMRMLRGRRAWVVVLCGSMRDTEDRNIIPSLRGPTVLYDLPAQNDPERQSWLWVLPSREQVRELEEFPEFPAMFTMTQGAKDGSCRWLFQTKAWLREGELQFKVLPVVTQQTGLGQVTASLVVPVGSTAFDQDTEEGWSG